MTSVFRTSIFLLSLVFLIVSSSHVTAADDDKPQIFINSGSVLGYITGTNIGLSRFSEIARAKGFDIDHGVNPDLVSGSPLDGVDVYILLDTNIPFINADKIALRQWVRAGGVLIIGDWSIFYRANGFLPEFGVEVQTFDSGNQAIFFTNNSPLNEPLTVNSMTSRSGRAINILDNTRSEAILRYADGKTALTRTISNAGKGEILAIGCLRLLFDDAVNGDLGQAQNDKLVQNLFTYIKNRLGGSSETGYDLNLLKVKFKKGTMFVPGEEIKMIARIRNIGTEISEDTRVAFYLKSVGSTPSATFEVTSATVPEIKAKKKIKIVKKTFLPDNLDPGTYEVIAVVDPDELTDDANTSNNGATAKKKIVIQ